MDDHEVRTTCAGVRDTEARPARGLQSAWRADEVLSFGSGY